MTKKKNVMLANASIQDKHVRFIDLDASQNKESLIMDPRFRKDDEREGMLGAKPKHDEARGYTCHTCMTERAYHGGYHSPV